MSSSSQLKIAVIQLCSGDVPADNQKQILEYLKQVSSETEVVFLPENSLYMKISSKSPLHSFENSDEIYLPFVEWAKQNNCHLLFGANPVKKQNGTANATVWIQPSGEVDDIYSKIHLFDVDVEGHKPVRESDQFVHGGKPTIIEINGWKLGLSICYDIRFAELYLHYMKASVDLITAPAAFLVPTGKAHWEILLRARAIENQAYVVAAAQAGTHHGAEGATRDSFGHSLVVDAWGRVLSDSESKLGVVELTLDKSHIQQVRKQIPMANHRKL